MRALPSDIANIVSDEQQLPPRQHLASSIRKRTKDGGIIYDYLLTVLESDHESTRNRLQAAEMLLNRGWGRPSETVDVTIQSGGNPLADLSVEQLRALAEHLTSTEGQFREIGPAMDDSEAPEALALPPALELTADCGTVAPESEAGGLVTERDTEGDFSDAGEHETDGVGASEYEG